MNLDLSKKQILLLFLAIVLVAAFIFGGYYLYLKPLNDKLERKQTELEMATQQLTIIDNQFRSIDDETSLSTMNLQRQVPVDRMLEQVMLTFEKAEILSDVTIKEIRMNSNATGETIEQPQEQVQNKHETEQQNAGEQGTDEEQQNEGEQTDGEEVENKPTTILDDSNEPSKPIILPQGMMKIEITISGDADTFFEFENFVKDLQVSQRIIKVDQVSLQGKDEIKDIKDIDNQEDLHFELTVSTFYFPKLTDLKNEIPPLDSPNGADKKNPLYKSF